VPVISEHRVAAVWLFAPAKLTCHAEIIPALKAAGQSWGLKVFVQVGSVQSAKEAVEDGADVLVVQGTDAGGHQWAHGASLMSLLPEVIDMLAEEFQGSHVQVIAGGGIMDGRGIAAALVLGRSCFLFYRRLLTLMKGASGVVMGTRVCPSYFQVFYANRSSLWRQKNAPRQNL
jgi:nitronate monooxygenase